MVTIARTLGIVVLISLCAWSLLYAAPAAAVPQDDVKQVYLDKCAVCHGEDGAAQTARGKKLKMKDIRSADVQKQTQQQWVDAILKGSGQDMDGYEKELGVDVSRRLAAYMRELAKTTKK